MSNNLLGFVRRNISNNLIKSTTHFADLQNEKLIFELNIFSIDCLKFDSLTVLNDTFYMSRHFVVRIIKNKWISYIKKNNPAGVTILRVTLQFLSTRF